MTELGESEQGSAGLSIVIPALDAAASLPTTLAALQAEAAGAEILVVDGGSKDETRALAEARGARVLASARGRGQQLRAGAEAAVGAAFFFLHADSRLEPGWRNAVEDFLARAGAEPRAACFRLALDDEHPGARRIERLANWRTRRLGLPYGDQGLVISRAAYRRLGGFRPLPLMEDVDLVRRLPAERIEILPLAVTTSAERYRRGGWWRRPLRNQLLFWLYWLGVEPARLARWYG